MSCRVSAPLSASGHSHKSSGLLFRLSLETQDTRTAGDEMPWMESWPWVCQECPPALKKGISGSGVLVFSSLFSETHLVFAQY